MNQQQAERLIAQQRSLADTIEVLAGLVRTGVPQFYGAESLEKHYDATWREVKTMFKNRLNVELGDKRKVRVPLRLVLTLDERLRHEIKEPVTVQELTGESGGQGDAKAA